MRQLKLDRKKKKTPDVVLVPLLLLKPHKTPEGVYHLVFTKDPQLGSQHELAALLDPFLNCVSC